MHSYLQVMKWVNYLASWLLESLLTRLFFANISLLLNDI
jgi:hypothetical protein